MTLLNALLQEAEAMDVYLVPSRSDGAQGTGTEQDPYNCATLANTSSKISITSIAIGAASSLTTVVTFTTASNHNYKLGDLVLVEGVSSYRFNGTFAVTPDAIDPKKFTCSVLGTGLSAPGAPLGTCRPDPYVFDAFMRKLSATTPVTVHLGPGTFETKGYGIAQDLVSWRPFSGLKLKGSGMKSTTLKLVGASYDDTPFHAVGCPPLGFPPYGAAFQTLDGFEAEDFTVDCNMAGQPSQATTCGAIFVRGQRVRLRRIRAINFARQSSSQECFVLVAGGAEIAKPLGTEILEDVPACVIEECLVEQPALNGVQETTCVLSFDGDSNLYSPEVGRLPAFQRGAVIRNCLVNCEFQLNPVEIVSITQPDVGGVSTVTARAPHGLSANDWFRVNGVILAGALDNAYVGSYQVLAIVNPTTFTYKPLDGGSPPMHPPDAGSTMWVGRFPSHFRAVNNVSVAQTGPSEWTVTVTTATAHFLAPSDLVNPANVVPGSVIPVWIYDSGTGQQWIGSGNGKADPRKVTAVPSRTTFQYTLGFNPGAYTGDYTLCWIGVKFQAVSVGSRAAVIEGNQIWNCHYGGPYKDTYSGGDLVVRKNHYRSVVTGPFHQLGNPTSSIPNVSLPQTGPGPTPRSATAPGSLVSSGTTATFTIPSTEPPHGLVTGQGVVIRNAMVGGVTAPTGTYNGNYVVASTPTTRQFTYLMKNALTGSADSSPPPLCDVTSGLSHVGLIATFQVASVVPHQLTVGQAVNISSAFVAKISSVGAYNGVYKVASVPTPTSFTYVMTNTPADQTDGTPNADSSSNGLNPNTPPTFDALWQIGHCVIEDNVIELIPTPTSYYLSMGISFWAFPNVQDWGLSAPIYRNVIIRRNVIRFVDGLTEGVAKALGIQLNFCQTALVEQNVIDLPNPTSIRIDNVWSVASNVRLFNNTNSSGNLIQGVVGPNPSPAPMTELVTDVSDALILAML